MARTANTDPFTRHLSLLTDVDVLSAERDGAYRKAEEYRQRAEDLPRRAEQRLADAFYTASVALKDDYESGGIDALTAMTGVLKLRSKDPSYIRLYGPARTSVTAAAFARIQPDAPVLYLGDGGNGIVAGDPTLDIIVNEKSFNPGLYQPFMAPDGYVNVPLRRLMEDDHEYTRVQTADFETLRRASVGHEAIQSLLNATKFIKEGGPYGPTTNNLSLADLEKAVHMLEAMGENFDTTALDKARATARADARASEWQSRQIAAARFRTPRYRGPHRCHP